MSPDRWSSHAVLIVGASLGLTPAVLAHEPAHVDLNLIAEQTRAEADAAWSQPLTPAFQQAAVDYDVPAELLLTLGKLGSAFLNRGAAPTIEDGYGVMALRGGDLGGDSLAQAADLLGLSTDQLKIDPVANVRGGAAVLDRYADEAGIDRSAGLDAWIPVVHRYAGLDVQNAQLFTYEVYHLLAAGFTVTNHLGEVFSIAPQSMSIDPEGLAPPMPEAAAPDYPPGTWDPAATCNYTNTNEGKDTVVVHTIEGTAAGARSWFKNCDSQVSAHYVVSEAGLVWQMVREEDRAWHVSCYNSWSIGIEHEGFAGSPSHPQPLYDASALLARDICDDWGIPKQKRTVRPGIIGHIDVTNCCCGTHWDPGPGWDWSYYIAQITGAPPPPDWDAEYVGQSYPADMDPGTTAIVWAEFNNLGTQTWLHAQTYLGTSSPQDRTSPFCTSYNWSGCNRPTDVDQSSVTTGQVGRFTFIITAPATPGAYVERYRLVREGVTWFGPEITWTINVTAPPPPPSQPGDFDGDFDVDLTDFGFFQACYTGTTVPQTDPACAPALLDPDTDVDLNDFGVFQGCMSGAGVTADLGCAD